MRWVSKCSMAILHCSNVMTNGCVDDIVTDFWFSWCTGWHKAQSHVWGRAIFLDIGPFHRQHHHYLLRMVCIYCCINTATQRSRQFQTAVKKIMKIDGTT